MDEIAPDDLVKLATLMECARVVLVEHDGLSYRVTPGGKRSIAVGLRLLAGDFTTGRRMVSDADAS
jgi:hypothetical protein